MSVYWTHKNPEKPSLLFGIFVALPVCVPAWCLFQTEMSVGEHQGIVFAALGRECKRVVAVAYGTGLQATALPEDAYAEVAAGTEAADASGGPGIGK